MSGYIPVGNMSADRWTTTVSTKYVRWRTIIMSASINWDVIGQFLDHNKVIKNLARYNRLVHALQTHRAASATRFTLCCYVRADSKLERDAPGRFHIVG